MKKFMLATTVAGLLGVAFVGCGGGSSQDVTLAKDATTPKIDSFALTNPNSLHIGDKPTFKAVFQSGRAAIADNGATVPVTITSTVAFSLPAITTVGDHTYVLTVTGTAGTSAPAKTAADAIQQKITSSISAISPALGYQTAGKTVNYTAEITNLTDTDVVWSTTEGAGTWSGGAWTAPNWPGAYHLKATASDGSYSTQTVVVVSAPQAYVALSSLKPVYGGTVVISPNFTGKIATIGTTQGGSEISASATSDTPITSPPLTATTSIWLRSTNAAGDFVDASLVAVPLVPAITSVTPANAYMVAGSVQAYAATVKNAADNTVTWTASAADGTLGGSWDGNGNWTSAQTPGDYTIKATAKADGVTAANTVAHVVGAPTIGSLTAASNPVPFGDHTAITAVFAAGTGKVDQGVGTITSGTPFDSGHLTAPKTFTLTVTSTTGKSTSQAITIGVQEVTLSAISPANVVATPGAAVIFTSTASNASDASVSWSANAGTMTTDGVWFAPSAPGTYTVTATSNANTSVKTSAQVTVVSDPTFTSMTALASDVLYGAPAQITPVFSGGVGIVDNGVGQVTSESAFTTPAVKGTTTFNLAVTDGTDSTNMMANPSAESGTIGHSIAADLGVVQDVTHAHSGAWTRAFVLAAGSNAKQFQNGVPVTPGKTYILNAWYMSSTTLTSVPRLQMVWKDVSGNQLPPTEVTLAPKSSIWQEATVQGIAPAGAVTMAPGFAVTPVAGEVGQSLYLDDIVLQRAAVGSVTITTSSMVVSGVTPTNVNLTSGHQMAFSASVTGGVNTNLVWSASGPGGSGIWSGSTWTAPGTAGSYTITATSSLDSTASASAQVNVVLQPSITSLTADSTQVTTGQSTNLTAVFANGVGVVDGGLGVVTSGQPFSSGPLTLATKFTLTVTDLAGDAVTRSLNINVNSGVGSMTGLVPSSKTLTLGHSAQINGGVVTGISTTTVIWSVNAIDGGNSTYGTISATGLYTAPATLPGAPSFQIRCRSSVDPTIYQTMQVSLVNSPQIISFTVN